MMDELYHHGILGMKWGVRRYQNKDGTLTAEGRKRVLSRNRTIRANKTSQQVEEIIDTMSSDDRNKVLAGSDEYLTFEEGCHVAKRILETKVGKTPISFFDLLEESDDTLNSVLGTRNGQEYRGKGHGYNVAKKGMDWYERNKQKFGYKKVVWGVRIDNEASIHIAKKLGFTEESGSLSKDGKWINYVKY